MSGKVWETLVFTVERNDMVVLPNGKFCALIALQTKLQVQQDSERIGLAMV